MSCRLDVSLMGDTTVVRFRDRTLDELNCDAIREELFPLANRPRLHLDLRHVTYLTSTALALLVSLRRQVKAAGGDVTLGNLQPLVQDVFAITGLARLFGLDDTKASA